MLFDWLYATTLCHYRAGPSTVAGGSLARPHDAGKACGNAERQVRVCRSLSLQGLSGGFACVLWALTSAVARGKGKGPG